MRKVSGSEGGWVGGWDRGWEGGGKGGILSLLDSFCSFFLLGGTETGGGRKESGEVFGCRDKAKAERNTGIGFNYSPYEDFD